MNEQTTPPVENNQAPLFPPIDSPATVSDEKPKRDSAADQATSDKLAVINLSQITMNYTVIAIVFLGIGILLGRLIFGSTGSNVDMEAIRGAIAEAVAQIDTGSGAVNALALVDDDPYLGPENAPVTIVEFSDFNCGFCGRFANETLKQITDTYGDNVRIVYRDLPIIGEWVSVESAIAAECAADQGKFWEYHNLLFNNTQARGREAYVGFAQELSLDVTTFTACLDDPASIEEVQLDAIDGQSLNITGTPHFIINGRRVSGALPFEQFQVIINAELKAAGVETAASQG
jgi:protein-disulfide isomerase